MIGLEDPLAPLLRCVYHRATCAAVLASYRPGVACSCGLDEALGKTERLLADYVEPDR